jgi:hypothetical protein
MCENCCDSGGKDARRALSLNWILVSVGKRDDLLTSKLQQCESLKPSV